MNFNLQEQVSHSVGYPIQTLMKRPKSTFQFL